MAKAILGFLAGCVITSLVVWFAVLPAVRTSYRAVGINDGEIAARAEVAQAVKENLGDDLVPGESQEVLFTVKTTDVVVVERNGVKTLRVVE